jgi:replicative DNA helicase
MKEKLQKLLLEIFENIDSYEDEVSMISTDHIEEGKFSDLAKADDTEKNKGLYIKTGFNALDNIIGGFLPGELSVIGARPGMGKTGLLLDIAINISKDKTNPALYINLETPLKKLTSRILENNIAKADDITNIELYLMSMQGNIKTIIDEIKKYIESKNVKIVFIDYIQLVSLLRSKKYRDLELTIIIRKLKLLAIQENIAIVVSSQLNRNVEYRMGDRKPSLSDLRDSGTLEQEGDKIMLLYRAEYYGLTEDCEGNDTRGVAEIIVAKNRNGDTGLASICYKKNAVSFSNCKNNPSDFGGINTDLIFN